MHFGQVWAYLDISCPSSPRMVQGTDFSLVVTAEFVELVGSGGRDRNADLGVMNPKQALAPVLSQAESQ